MNGLLWGLMDLNDKVEYKYFPFNSKMIQVYSQVQVPHNRTSNVFKWNGHDVRTFL